MEKTTLQTDHPRWDEFIVQLIFVLFFDLEFDPMNPSDKAFWHIERILANMDGIDAKETINYIKANFCNCDGSLRRIA